MPRSDGVSDFKPHVLQFTNRYVEFLADAREAADLALAGCEQCGWDAKRDVRPSFVLRMLNLTRGLAYLLACAARGPDDPRATLLAARLEEEEIGPALDAVSPFLWWGTMATWFGAFELAVLDLARGIREQDESAPFRLTRLSKSGRRSRDTFGNVSERLASHALVGDARRRFVTFCGLAGALRNTVHMHGIHNPWAKADVLTRLWRRTWPDRR